MSAVKLVRQEHMSLQRSNIITAVGLATAVFFCVTKIARTGFSVRAVFAVRRILTLTCYHALADILPFWPPFISGGLPPPKP